MNANTETTTDDERYEECDVCEGEIDAYDAGYYKSTNDQTFRHSLCHENSEAPDGYVFELTDTDKRCINEQFNCGHRVYAPFSEIPMFCPECNNLEYGEDGWSVVTENDTEGDQ